MNTYQVLKRDGTVADFQLDKITNAITKAFVALDKPLHPAIINMLTLRVTADFESKVKKHKIAVEDIQDSVESVLSECGYSDVAKAYILYRKQREKVRNANTTLLNYKDIIDNYLGINDWRVKENSTVSYSVGGLILSNSGAVTANYWLSEVYDEETANAHRNADIHIHDLSMLTGYCFTGDTEVFSPTYGFIDFKTLVEREIQNLDVFAYDIENKEIKVACAENPRITHQVSELVEVILSNGATIRCTPEHPFLLNNGTYVNAGNLPIGAELRSMTIGRISVTRINYIQLDNKVDVYDLTVPIYHNFALGSGVFVHNCAGWSLKQLIVEGLGGVAGKITSAPASHLSTLCNQMVNFLGILQNEWAGNIQYLPA